VDDLHHEPLDARADLPSKPRGHPLIRREYGAAWDDPVQRAAGAHQLRRDQWRVGGQRCRHSLRRDPTGAWLRSWPVV